jgi:hypothetical protein
MAPFDPPTGNMMQVVRLREGGKGMLNGLVCQSRVAGFQELILICHITIYLENIDGFVVRDGYLEQTPRESGNGGA